MSLEGRVAVGLMAFHPPEVDGILEIPVSDAARVQGPWGATQGSEMWKIGRASWGGLRLQHGSPKVSIICVKDR